MPFKPNYNHQRAERLRAKEQKKLEKRQRREDEAARRKGTFDESRDPDAGGTIPGETMPDDTMPDDIIPDDTMRGGTTPATPSEDADGPQKTTN